MGILHADPLPGRSALAEEGPTGGGKGRRSLSAPGAITVQSGSDDRRELQMTRKKVLVLGGNFAGLTAA
jgi:hypothetical protein